MTETHLEGAVLHGQLKPVDYDLEKAIDDTHQLKKDPESLII